MVTLHLHVVGVQADGSDCPLGKHIPGALVQFSGAVGNCPQGGEVRTGANGVASIDFSALCYGPFTLAIHVTTPGGKTADLPVQNGYWFPWVGDVTWVVGVPGACNEGKVGADAAAWWDGFGDVGKLAILAGALLVGYVVVRAVTSPKGRETIRQTVAGVKRTGEVVKATGTRVVKAVKERI